MECWVVAILCLAITFAPQILGALFYHHLSDEEILDFIGDNWKDSIQIRIGLIDTHKNWFGGPFPYPSLKFLSKKLPKLVRQGYLENRESIRYEAGQYCVRIEYRVVSKKYRRKGPKNKWLIPEVNYEGVV